MPNSPSGIPFELRTGLSSGLPNDQLRERMHEAEKVIERDRYKSDEVIKQREKEYYALYEEIKRRVKMRGYTVLPEQRIPVSEGFPITTY